MKKYFAYIKKSNKESIFYTDNNIFSFDNIFKYWLFDISYFAENVGYIQNFYFFMISSL